jgi:hypothetical protein
MVNAGQIEPSAQWQTAVFLFAGGCILVNAVRGWEQGLMRQATGILAFFAAGFLVWQYTGRMEAFLRPHLPTWILIPVSAVVIWVVSFNSIALVGRLLFKRTRDCESSLVRLTSGLGGAAIGLGYGLLFVFCVLIAMRIVGRIAENQVEIQQSKNENSGVLILSLAKLKNSVELGFGRRMLDWVDPLPRNFYRVLDQSSWILADPETIRKVLEFPGFTRLWKSSQILQIERDPEIAEEVQRGDILGVVTNQKIVALLEDPQMRNVFSSANLDAALDYASTSRPGRRPQLSGMSSP